MVCAGGSCCWPWQRWSEPSGAGGSRGGTGRNPRSFPAPKIPRFHGTAVPQQGQSPAPGWAPSLAAARLWACSGPVLGSFWARSGPVLGRVRPPSLLPVPCPALSPSEELWRLRHRSHSVLFGESTPPAQDYPADSHIDVIYAAFQLFLRQMGRSHPSPCEI